MAKGNEIIVSANPRGVFLEGPITGAIYPGIVMQIDVSEGLDDTGRCTWEPYNQSADGDNPSGPLAILLPDQLRGKIATDAYADGDHGFLYVPVAGEEFNLMVADVAGTGDDHTFGEKCMIDDSTGKLIVTTGSPESEPFALLAASTDPVADALTHVIFSGF